MEDHLQHFGSRTVAVSRRCFWGRHDVTILPFKLLFNGELVNVKLCLDILQIACEQALRGDLAAGREKEGELATGIYKTYKATPWPVLWPTLWPTHNFAFFTKITRKKGKQE